MSVQLDPEALKEFLDKEFPQVANDFVIETVGVHTGTIRMKVADRHLRPGGTISGPAMFSLADCAIYLTLLAQIGPKALAVTTNATLDFMRKPTADRDLIAECRILKLGRVLAVGDVLIYSEGQSAPVARSSMTYSIPPER